MSHELTARNAPQTPPSGLRLGERLRQLRVAAGLTQSELAGDRFSKEYVSQIERGKTRPTRETIGWLAAQLGVDPGFLANGVSTDERGRLDAALSRVEAMLQSGRGEEAHEEFASLLDRVRATGLPELEIRALVGDARALMRLGEHRPALPLLTRARHLVEGPGFSDVERADVLLALGICRYNLQSTQTSLGLFNEALSLAERSGMPCDSLRSKILAERSRCWRRHRDYMAAREDIERALELAEGISDPRTTGDAYFQASLVAERQGHWVLARSYAERARAAYEELADRANVGRMTNNLGGLNNLLGKPETAVEQLKEAFRIALDLGNLADAGQAVNGLARVHLETGRPDLAEEQARQALKLLDGRVDFLYETGNAQLVLARALLEQERLDDAEEAARAGEAIFEQVALASQRAAAWVVRGDIAARRGDDRTSARLYRNAAEALQDFRF